MEFDAEILEDRLLARYQEAVTAGLLKQAVLVGDDSAVDKSVSKLPGVAILHRAGGMDDPVGIDITRQEGIIEWSVFAAGMNLRDNGPRSGRRGPLGAYHALKIAQRYARGFEIEPGFPIWIARWELVAWDEASGRATYEMTIRHRWYDVEFGYGEE